MSQQIQNTFKFLLYQSGDEYVCVNALVKDETIWLTKKMVSRVTNSNYYNYNK